MLGLFSDLPPVLRIVTLSTGGAFLVCTFAIIQYLLPVRSMVLRCGMAVLLGGILGNVADRIFWGYVVDFIVIGSTKMSSPAFNLADALQWVGYGMIVFALVKESSALWPEKDTRKVYWINPQFQLKYCFILVGVGLGLSLIGLVFSYTYLRVTIIDLIGHNDIVTNKFLVPFTITYGVIAVAFCAILFAVGRILSHRTAGPLYAFERFIEELVKVNGHKRKLKLRAGDEFKHLEQLADRLQNYILTDDFEMSKNLEDTAQMSFGIEQEVLVIKVPKAG